MGFKVVNVHLVELLYFEQCDQMAGLFICSMFGHLNQWKFAKQPKNVTSVITNLTKQFPNLVTLVRKKTSWYTPPYRSRLWVPKLMLGGLFLKNGPSRPLFVYFRSSQTIYRVKTVEFSRIRTQIVGIDGKHTDRLTFHHFGTNGLFLLS